MEINSRETDRNVMKAAGSNAISGLGPHGEKATPPERLSLSESEAAEAHRRRFEIAIVLHTTGSDWAKQQLAGIVTTLGRYSAAVVEVVDCNFDVARQTREIERLTRYRPAAIVSIPIGNAEAADVHRGVSQAGIKLVLIDNVPTGLLPSKDYVSVISADNFGLGQMAANLRSPHVPRGGVVGIIAYGVDFFVTNERDIAFRKWMAAERPDVAIKRDRFSTVEDAARATDALLRANPTMNGLFTVWDDPAMRAVKVVRERSQQIPITTIDLGNDAAIELARGEMIKGIGAQQPYDQGVAAAKVTIMSLLDRHTPPWVVLPGLKVTATNVVEAYQVVWHSPAPPELIKSRRNGERQG
jgi:ribose transport system substrate-binding protein